MLFSLFAVLKKDAPYPAGTAVFFGGTTASSTANATISTYGFANDAVNVGPNAMTYNARSLGACGNSAVAYAIGGADPSAGSLVATSLFLTYASGVWAAGPALFQSIVDHVCFSNATTGISYLGRSTGDSVSYLSQISFAGNTRNTYNLAQQNSQQGAGWSNATAGLVYGGYNTNATNTTPMNLSTKYTYSSNTVASWTTITGISKLSMAGYGDSTNACFAGGRSSTSVAYSTVIVKMGIAASTQSSGASLGTAQSSQSGASNGTVGLIAGGQTTGAVWMNATSKHTLAGDTVVAGTDLGSVRAFGAGVSTTPGGF